MYGWEFPPHISGGLGVACFGMTQALYEQKHEISFVLPRLKTGTKDKSHVNLLGINQSPQANVGKNVHEKVPTISDELQKYIDGIEIKVVNSPISPYITEPEYLEMMKKIDEAKQLASESDKNANSSVLDVNVSGDYGPNLIAEILRYAGAAGRIAKSVEHDVIHTHDWLTMLAGIEAKRISKKPLIVHVHALEFDRSGEKVNQVVYDIERHGMEQADKVIAVSYYTKNIIVKKYGINPNKVEVVHNAVTRSESPLRNEYKKTRKEKVVLFLGRITFQKGPDYFVEAAHKVLSKRDDVRFVMAGSGDMAPQMIERIAELKLGRKFHFTGFLSGLELEKIFLESNVYVMPSVSEPFGISPLEAMYYDVPVIISKQSGVAEVLKNALKVDFWDVDDLASKILSVLDHSSLRQELIRQGAKELEKIKWSKAAKQISEIYEEAI